jgi:hypothetical protein
VVIDTTKIKRELAHFLYATYFFLVKASGLKQSAMVILPYFQVL